VSAQPAVGSFSPATDGGLLALLLSCLSHGFLGFGWPLLGLPRSAVPSRMIAFGLGARALRIIFSLVAH